jgi:hypothetical protein
MAAITPKKLVQRLEAADKKLEQVKQQLIRCAPLDSHVIPLLNQIDALLQSVQNERDLISGNEPAQQLLKDIQARTENTRTLLESAARLICHSSLARPSIEGSYTPDGQFPSIEFSGRLVVHA